MYEAQNEASLKQLIIVKINLYYYLIKPYDNYPINNVLCDDNDIVDIRKRYYNFLIILGF